ncbi:MAG: antitoxin [Spirochaetota bacterium]
MRTTVTLDPDVEQLLKDHMHRTHGSFKETLNQAVRKGLTDTHEEPPEPFRVSARSMGLRTGIDPARLNSLSDDLETDAFLETAETLQKDSHDHS